MYLEYGASEGGCKVGAWCSQPAFVDAHVSCWWTYHSCRHMCCLQLAVIISVGKYSFCTYV